MMIRSTRAHYMATLVPLAMRYVAAVHDDGPDAASEVLDAVYAVPRPPGVVASRALMTVLAAMVNPGDPSSRLLGWVAELPAAQTPTRVRHRHPQRRIPPPERKAS